MTKVRPAGRPRDSSRPHNDALNAKDGALDTSRERIHQSALKLFSRYGYEGVSLQMIADDVGLHKSSLFHHYSGKLELMSEAVQSVISSLVRLMHPLLVQDEPSLETLYEGIYRFVDHFTDYPDDARLMVTIMTAPSDSEVAKLTVDESTIEFYVQLSSWLARARERGVIRNTSIRQAIPNLIGLVLFYPAVAGDLRELVGPNAFSVRARQIRKDEVIHLVKALFAP